MKKGGKGKRGGISQFMVVALWPMLRADKERKNQEETKQERKGVGSGKKGAE